MTLYARQQKRYRCVERTFGLWGRVKERVGWFGRMALKHVYCHVRNESPVYVRYRILDAWGWCTGMIQRDDMGWEMGGGFRVGNSCTPVVDSCMAKPIQYCKKIKNKREIIVSPVSMTTLWVQFRASIPQEVRRTANTLEFLIPDSVLSNTHSHL